MAKGGSKSKATKGVQPQSLPSHLPKSDAPDAGNVDKIRDILFGNQMRDYDHRLVEMKDFIQNENEELRNDIQKQIESFEV